MDHFNRTLLIVDDEAIIATAEAEFLQNEGFSVIYAYTGESALEIIRNGKIKIDLVLMDIDLGKGMNGIDTAQEIIKSWNIPVVFLSSYSESTIVIKTKNTRSHGYVMKGSSEDVLLEKIKSVFKP